MKSANGRKWIVVRAVVTYRGERPASDVLRDVVEAELMNHSAPAIVVGYYEQVRE